VQAARLGLRVKEIGVPRVYLDMKRAFGGALDDAEQRLTYYRSVLADADRRWAERASVSEYCRETYP
jgi:dolichol-phosphate mannosyltransferase